MSAAGAGRRGASRPGAAGARGAGIVVAAAALALLSLLVATLALPAPVRAAEPRFGPATIDGALGQPLTVTQEVTLDEVPDRVEVLVTYADAFGPLVTAVDVPSSPGRTTLRWTADATLGSVVPNTPVRARWRITTGDATVLGPEVDTVVADERFDWQTVRGDVIRVHWYEGGRDFGERALRIGERAVADTADLLGVTEDDPIDFFIYADRDAFYDAMGPGTRENVGGTALSHIRTLFALIPPSSIDDPWVSNVVPHELVHLVFDTASRNPYHYPPRWLNEGLATYLAQGYDVGDRGAVERAAERGTLIPLDGLTGQFPTSGDRFGLAYSISVSVVDHVIRVHGRDALVGLIRSYAQGRTDDEAFEAAIGMDVAALNEAWLAELGAVPPTRYGPQPAPPGPDPWGEAPAPGATAGPSATPGSGGGPASPGQPDDPVPTSSLAMLLVGVVVVGGLVVIGGLVLRRSRSPRRPASAPPGDGST